MTLFEALENNRIIKLHISTENGHEVSGTYTISKANFSGGYYVDFKNDDPKQRPYCSTSSHRYERELRGSYYDRLIGWQPSR
jgi:hypothetical protein